MIAVAPITGRVERLLIDCLPDDKIGTDRDQIRCTLIGIDGDKHATPTRDSSGVREREMFNRPKRKERAQIVNWRQWTAVSVEEMQLVASKYGLPTTREVALELGRLVGANMVVSGIPHFTCLPPTSLLAFPNCSWVVITENLPCKGAGDQIEKVFPEAKAALFAKHALGIRGLVGMVFEGGDIQVGDPIEVRRRGIELRQTLAADPLTQARMALHQLMTAARNFGEGVISHDRSDANWRDRIRGLKQYLQTLAK